jgi:hypothetical protein
MVKVILFSGKPRCIVGSSVHSLQMKFINKNCILDTQKFVFISKLVMGNILVYTSVHADSDFTVNIHLNEEQCIATLISILATLNRTRPRGQLYIILSND